MRLREYFHDTDYEDISIVGHSNFTPPKGRDSYLDNYIDHIKQFPVEKKKGKYTHSNITQQQRSILYKLGSRQDIVIKEADKGSAVVIMGKEFYENGIKEMLAATETYQVISSDIDRTTVNKISALLDKYDNCTKKEKRYLTNFDYRTSQFYGLPKIHKSKTIIKAINDQNLEYIEILNPPDLKFRPIVAGPACPTHRISHLIDQLILPFVKFVKSYVRDDLDFLGHIPNTISTSETFVTFDVSSLYSNISHELGIKAIDFWLDKLPHLINSRFPKDFIIEAIKIILQNNNFQFGNTHYLQLLGTAMGTKFAPNYATLVLGYLEEKMYDDFQESKGLEFRKHIEKKFKRYLDDCFIIWDESWENIRFLHDKLNNLDPNLKFTIEHDKDNIAFLDVQLNRGPDNEIITDVYYKPTDTKQYLNFKSCHPRHTKNNIPFNLARRICTIVSDNTLRNMRLAELKSYLLKQEYPLGLIKSAFEKAQAIPPEVLRSKSEKQNTDVIPFVTTFNPNISDPFGSIRSNLPYLQKSETMKQILKTSKIIKSNRQPPNLKRLLTKARFSTDKQFEVKKCGNKRCKLCKNLIEATQFTFQPNMTFKVNADMDCNTKNCIYVLICEGCTAFYIGQTNDLRLRINLHRNDIKYGKKLYVDKHIHVCAKNKDLQFKVMPFFKLKGTNDTQTDREGMEKHFIDKYSPSLNREFNFSQ